MGQRATKVLVLFLLQIMYMTFQYRKVSCIYLLWNMYLTFLGMISDICW